MTVFDARGLIGLVAIACTILVVALFFGHEPAAAVAKLVASSGFVALAIRLGSLQSTYGRVILTGLAFSWFGDAFLIGQSQLLFVLGLGAFLLAHLAYITAFVGRGMHLRTIAVAALPVLAIAIAVTIWLRPHVPAELEFPVRLYTTVISLMVVSAFGTHSHNPSTLILAGATMFFLSDLSVAALRLVQTDMPTYLLGLPLYYASQVCFAVSTSQSRSQGGTPEKRSARKSISARTR